MFIEHIFIHCHQWNPAIHRNSCIFHFGRSCDTISTLEILVFPFVGIKFRIICWNLSDLKPFVVWVQLQYHTLVTLITIYPNLWLLAGIHVFKHLVCIYSGLLDLCRVIISHTYISYTFRFLYTQLDCLICVE